MIYLTKIGKRPLSAHTSEDRPMTLHDYMISFVMTGENGLSQFGRDVDSVEKVSARQVGEWEERLRRVHQNNTLIVLGFQKLES